MGSHKKKVSIDENCLALSYLQRLDCLILDYLLTRVEAEAVGNRDLVSQCQARVRIYEAQSDLSIREATRLNFESYRIGWERIA